MLTIKVLPNPWAAFDKHKTPCGLCPRDPDADAGGPGQFVGAKVDPTDTVVLQKLEPWEHRSPMQRTVYRYLGISALDPELANKLLVAEPIEIPSTTYYRARLQEGSIVCVDEASAKIARLKGHFTPPSERFAPFLATPKAAEEVTPAAIEATAISEAEEATPVPAATEDAAESTQANRRKNLRS